jgi:hypothetical protein
MRKYLGSCFGLATLDGPREQLLEDGQWLAQKEPLTAVKLIKNILIAHGECLMYNTKNAACHIKVKICRKWISKK